MTSLSVYTLIVCVIICFTEVQAKYLNVECLPPRRLVHYRVISERYPCYIMCKHGRHFKKCGEEELLFCDEGDTNCQCVPDPTEDCEPEYYHNYVDSENGNCFCPVIVYHSNRF